MGKVQNDFFVSSRNYFKHSNAEMSPAYIASPDRNSLGSITAVNHTLCAGELMKNCGLFIKKGGKSGMNHSQEKFKGEKTKIITEIAELSRLLGMIPSDDTIEIHEPVTQNKMILSDWISATRDSFLKLSLSISKELDIQLQ